MSRQLEARRQRFMPGGVPRLVRCYDNAGDSIDRYTVVFTGRYRNGTAGEFVYLAMNARPFHPQGFGQHGFSREQIDRPRSRQLGRRVKFEKLPADCRQCVIRTYRELWSLNEQQPEETCPPKALRSSLN